MLPIVHHFTRDFVEVVARDKDRGWRFYFVLSVTASFRSSVCWHGWQEEKKDDVFDHQECRYFKLTTKNEYLNSNWIRLCSLSYYIIIFNSVYSPNYFMTRIWSPWATDLWRGCQGTTLQEEDTGSDWCARCRPSQSEEQTAGVGSPAVWHYHPLWVQPFINCVHGFFIHLVFSVFHCFRFIVTVPKEFVANLIILCTFLK